MSTYGFSFERQAGGSVKRGWAIRAGCVSRLLPWGQNWSALKIAVEFVFNTGDYKLTYGINTKTRFYIGLTTQAATFNSSYEIPHYYGMLTSGANVATYSTYPTGGFNFTSSGIRIGTQVGAVITDNGGTVSSGTAGWCANPASVVATMVQIEKGTPNWQARLAVPNAASNGLITSDTAIRAMLDTDILDIVSWHSQYQRSNAAATSAIDEGTNGPLDSVFIGFQHFEPWIDLYRVFIRRVA